MLLKPISRLEEAFRDTTLAKAQGDQSDVVDAQCGFLRPTWVKRQYWRTAVLKTAFGPRGCAQTLFSFLRYALEQLNESVTVTVDGDTAQYGVDAGPGVTFTQKHNNRYILLTDSAGAETLYYSVVASSALLTLAKTGTTQWSACPKNLPSGTYTATVLPFLLFELTPSIVYPTDDAEGGTQTIPSYYLGKKSESCLIRIRLFSFLWQVPGTYVQGGQKFGGTETFSYLEDFVPSAALGGPLGGYVQTSENDPKIGAAGKETYPIYLGEGLANANLLKKVLETVLLAAGVRVEFEIMSLEDE
jgi:hypothetical protein